MGKDKTEQAAIEARRESGTYDVDIVICQYKDIANSKPELVEIMQCFMTEKEFANLAKTASKARLNRNSMTGILRFDK